MVRVLILGDRTLASTEIAYLFIKDKPIFTRKTGIHNLVSIVIVVNDLASATTLAARRANNNRAVPPAGFAGFHRTTPFAVPNGRATWVLTSLGVGFGGGSLLLQS
jgi:hypothetical protein